MRDYQVVVYGAYGYTGSLIVEQCKTRNLRVLLAGRNAGKLKQQSDATGLDFEAADINDHTALCALLKKAQLVIHCGGPFQFTARQMTEACLETGTSYTDITG
ncbi:MAG TPA: saccharopine dehydrogenase NADP-binding domain-containing protein, partial [Ohtaekwangia sp.]|nr:saccharopine dehydrogenase NADP-binding domain-containing protein [Ohtaekwangia sp.]